MVPARAGACDGCGRDLTGRQQRWFRQFSAEWTAHGSLQLYRYELQRVGEGGDDTDYILKAQKADPLSEGILDKEEVKELPSIPQVFRGSVRGGRAAVPDDGLLGGDSLDGAAAELPAATLGDDDELL